MLDNMLDCFSLLIRIRIRIRIFIYPLIAIQQYFYDSAGSVITIYLLLIDKDIILSDLK
jgi:hypothetical protein